MSKRKYIYNHGFDNPVSIKNPINLRVRILLFISKIIKRILFQSI